MPYVYYERCTPFVLTDTLKSLHSRPLTALVSSFIPSAQIHRLYTCYPLYEVILPHSLVSGAHSDELFNLSALYPGYFPSSLSLKHILRDSNDEHLKGLALAFISKIFNFHLNELVTKPLAQLRYPHAFSSITCQLWVCLQRGGTGHH